MIVNIPSQDGKLGMLELSSLMGETVVAKDNIIHEDPQPTITIVSTAFHGAFKVFTQKHAATDFNDLFSKYGEVLDSIEADNVSQYSWLNGAVDETVNKEVCRLEELSHLDVKKLRIAESLQRRRRRNF